MSSICVVDDSHHNDNGFLFIINDSPDNVLFLKEKYDSHHDDNKVIPVVEYINCAWEILVVFT